MEYFTYIFYIVICRELYLWTLLNKTDMHGIYKIKIPEFHFLIYISFSDEAAVSPSVGHNFNTLVGNLVIRAKIISWPRTKLRLNSSILKIFQYIRYLILFCCWGGAWCKKVLGPLVYSVFRTNSDNTSSYHWIMQCNVKVSDFPKGNIQIMICMKYHCLLLNRTC